MTAKRLAAACTALLLLACLAPALAEDEAAGAAAYARNLEFAGGRAVELAGAIPEDKYGWRPMEGVRSVSEAIMHMASANYFFASRLGTAVPEGVDMANMEKITDKAECVSTLERSIEHLGKAFHGVTDPGAEVEIFGRQGTVEDMMLIAIGHVHEHFGQLIAYARTNRVVPPWSQSQDG